MVKDGLELEHNPKDGRLAGGHSRAAAAAAGGVASSEFETSRYIRLALKHRFLILGCILAATVLGLAFTLLSTRIYTASTTIQIDRQSARVLSAEADVAPIETLIAGEEFFQTQYGLLRSRALAEQVSASLGLANSDAFMKQMGVNVPSADNRPNAAVRLLERRRDVVVDLIVDNTRVSPVRGSRLVVISFDSPDPQLSAKIANAVATNFIQANLSRRFESTRYVREFLDEQISQTKAKLEDAERQLVAYAAQQQIVNVVDDSHPNARSESLVGRSLVSLNSALAVSRSARIAAEARWRQANASPLMTLPEVLENPSIQRLAEQRTLLQAEYEQKLQVYRPEYPEMQQLRSRIDELEAEITALASNIRTSLRSQYTVALNEERALEAQVAGLTGDVLNLRDRSVQYNILLREVDTSRTLYDGLLQRYKEVGVTGGVTTNNVSIVDAAEVPERPSKPRLLLNLAIAAVFGLGLGALAALLIEALDETLAKPDDIEQKLGLPVLGVIPLLDKDETPGSAMADIRSGFSEAYYLLRTALQFSTPNGTPASLLVTSSRPGEGKSTSAYAIALSLARIGKNVLLVDGDLRNPSMHRTLDLENSRGVSTLLAGGGKLSDMVQTSKVKNLSLLPSGPLPPNPAELWAGDRLRLFLQEAKVQYDHVVIDGPPVLGFADSPLLASATDGTLFVLEAKGVGRSQARGALRRLSIGQALIIGIVLTKLNTKSSEYGGYDYGYDYGYGARNEEAERSKIKAKR